MGSTNFICLIIDLVGRHFQIEYALPGPHIVTFSYIQTGKRETTSLLVVLFRSDRIIEELRFVKEYLLC